MPAFETLEERRLLAGGPGGTIGGVEYQFGELELTDVFFNEGDRYFGANEVITVSGVAPNLSKLGCPNLVLDAVLAGGGRLVDPFPTVDLYVIEDTGEPIPPGADLEALDVSGGVNRVVALSSGAFVSEVVATTGKDGLESGRYDIVMHQCLSGKYNPLVDIVLGEGRGFAFQVTIADDIPLIDFSDMKDGAQLYADGASLFGDGVGELEDAGKEINKQTDGGPKVQGLGLLGVMQTNLSDMTKHWEGIAADPPDENFTEIAEISAVDYDFASFGDAAANDDPLLRSFRRVNNVLAEQSATAEAFLTTLERFQGAQQAGEDLHVLRQLNHLDELIDLQYGPGGNQLRLYGALEALDLALREDPVLQDLPETAAFLDEIRGMRRGIGGLMQPLAGGFIKDPEDFTRSLPYGLRAWIRIYNGNEPILALEHPGIPQVRETQGLPPLVFQDPDAQTTGPYTAPPGEMVTFDAGPSTDPNGDALTFAWDLDMDGEFDDGTGQIVQQSFSLPGSRLVGLKATDTDGNSDVEYVLVKVGDRTVQDIIAIQHSPRDLYRIDPEGNVELIAEHPIPRRAGAAESLQLDLNDDIFILDDGGNALVYHLNPDGQPVKELTREEFEQFLGREIDDVDDMILDGRGDLLITAKLSGENLWLIARVNRDFTEASVVTESIRSLPHTEPSLAIDPEGRIIVSDVGHMDGDPAAAEDHSNDPYGHSGIIAVDPDEGSIEQILSSDQVRLKDGRYILMRPEFGGAGIGSPLGFYGSRNDGGIEIDQRGNYIIASGNLAGSGPDIIRFSSPPELRLRGVNGNTERYGLQIFPQLPVGGDIDLRFDDMAVDAGGDVIVVGVNSRATIGKGAWRISPVGEVFRIAEMNFDGSGNFAFDVTGEVREVTSRDVITPPIIPELQLEALVVDQSSLPDEAGLGVTLTNTGDGAQNDLPRVFFYDGDPLHDGTLLGAVRPEGSLGAGESIDVSLDWAEPEAGSHEVYAMAIGANTLSAGFLVGVPTEPPGGVVTMTPSDDDLDVGTTHTVTAVVHDLFGDPLELANLPIDFEVTGANPVSTTEVTTDDAGLATFSYAGENAGEDTISATFVDAPIATAAATWIAQANQEPDAEAGGPYAVDEGASVVLDASGSSDPDQPADTLTYEWDLDGDGVFGETGADAGRGDEAGLPPSFSAAGLDGPDSSPFTVSLQVTDAGGLTDTDTAEIELHNVAPEIVSMALSADPINEGQSVTVTGTFDDPARGVATETFTGAAVWSDGVETILVIDEAAGSFETTREFPDDHPDSGTTADDFTVAITIEDDDLGSDTATSPVLTVNNVDPEITSINLSAPDIHEGQSVTVAGTFVDEALGVATETFTGKAMWSDGVETILVIDEAAGTFKTIRNFPDDHPDNGTAADDFTVAITIEDDDLGSDTATAPVLTVHNVDPEITEVTSSSPGCGGAGEHEEVTVSGTFTDRALGVPTESFTATIDWGDGEMTEADIDAPSDPGFFSGSHSYDEGGVYTITVTIEDDDTGLTTEETTAVITGAGVNNGVLYVIGTEDRDRVHINRVERGRHGAQYKVHADFLPDRGRWRAIDADQNGDGQEDIHKIAVILCGGGDHATIASNVTVPATMDGGAGDDHLNGGGGSNLIWGGIGDDRILGGGTSDLLIGGSGADRIIANSGQDILIGGRTDYDSDDSELTENFDSALRAILERWSERDDFSSRVSQVSSGITNPVTGSHVRLDDTTVQGDSSDDRLTGASDFDWFFGEEDELTDFHAVDEVFTEIEEVS